MYRVAIAAALALAGCANEIKRVEPYEFSEHGRFKATAPRDQAFLECRLVAESAGRQMMATGAPGALPQLVGIPPAVLREVYRTMQICMESKGFRWDTPR